MKQYLAARIRKHCFDRHSDLRKTSHWQRLCFLKQAPAIGLGKLLKATPSVTLTRKKSSAKYRFAPLLPFAWGSTKINLIDTPGLFDLAGEAARVCAQQKAC